MDNIQEIAISKIADILSSSNLIVPQVDIWKRIFNNAGLNDLFNERIPQFTTKVVSYGYGADERNLYHNELCYNALLESFLELYYEFDSFTRLLNSIATKTSLCHIFNQNFESFIKKKKPFSKYISIEEYISSIHTDERNLLLKEYPSKDFQALRININMLGLDFAFISDDFSVIPFTAPIQGENFDNNLVYQWLVSKYSKVAESYESAKKAYGNGDSVGCLTHCRNIITGIFSYKKDTVSEWVKGLQTVCAKDKNILSITSPKNIPTFKYDSHSTDINKKYHYPRFNTIYQLYVFTCDLGAHSNEGNLIDGAVDSEDTDMFDAYMGLRMTEDVLIWLYQNGN